MPTVVLILLLTIFTIFFIPERQQKAEEAEEDLSKNPQMKKLWSMAQSAMRERKPLKAEKALLTILKFDEKNAAAYNRLGILYAREKHFKEAIECFEIAQSLNNNASSLHNVGLIYLETGKYEKAAIAFEQAIEMEGDQPGRYIAYAKALEKLGQTKNAIKQLETAYDLNPTTVILRHMLEIYEHEEDFENIEDTKRRIEELQLKRAELAAKEEKAKKAKKADRDTKRTATRVARQEAKAARDKAKAATRAARQEAKTARDLQKQQIKQSAAKRKLAKKRKIM